MSSETFTEKIKHVAGDMKDKVMSSFKHETEQHQPEDVKFPLHPKKDAANLGCPECQEIVDHPKDYAARQARHEAEDAKKAEHARDPSKVDDSITEPHNDLSGNSSAGGIKGVFQNIKDWGVGTAENLKEAVYPKHGETGDYARDENGEIKSTGERQTDPQYALAKNKDQENKDWRTRQSEGVPGNSKQSTIIGTDPNVERAQYAPEHEQSSRLGENSAR